jgi:hypothetical protein
VGAQSKKRRKRKMKLIIFIIVYLFSFHEPNNKILKDSEKINTIAKEIYNAESKFDTEPKGLVAYWGFHEARYNENAKGKLGEIGVCQAHGVYRKICTEYGLDMKKRSDQFMCMALLFDMGKRKFGDVEKSLRVYASGSKYKAKKLVKARLNRLEKIKRKFIP